MKKKNGLNENQEILNCGELKGGVIMDINDSILQNVREAVGLSSTNADFDTELLMHINTAIGNLNQAGVGKSLVVTTDAQTWSELQDPTQTEGNKFFQMVFSYIALSTKLIFDPPPPSAVDYQTRNVEQILWRLKLAYEEPYTTTTTTIYE